MAVLIWRRGSIGGHMIDGFEGALEAFSEVWCEVC